jgi:Immunity protein 32
MISIEYKVQEPRVLPDEIEMNLDAEGLSILLSELKLLQDGRTDHIHLMSEAWGGMDLVDQPRNQGFAIVHHMKIMLRKEP